MHGVPRSTACVLLLVAMTQGACYRTRRDVQRDIARKLQPAALAEANPSATAARPLSIRVLVDEGYRAENPRWRERIEAQLERANVVLAAQFGVRLAVKELRPWSRTGRPRDLAEALDELAAAEPGGDVECVVGFVSSLGMFSGPTENIGMAFPFGRHVVVRSMVSSAEAEAFRRSLDALPEHERDDLLRDRELHREAAVLLHEWAHTLGAIHERDPDSIMSPLYAPAATAFSPTSARLVALGLARRAPAAPGAGAAWAREYREAVDGARGVAWDASTVENALAAAERLASAPTGPPRSVGGAGAAGAAEAEPRGDTAVLATADLNDRMGDPGQALRLVEPIAARLRTHGRLQEYACHLRRRAGQTVAPGDACRRQEPLTGRAAALLFARVLLEEGDRPRALEVLLRAETALAGARPRAPARDWGELAGVLSQTDACTAAERVAARAPSDAEARRAASRCERTRRRAALPTGRVPVEPAREPEYIDAVLRARAEAEAGRVVPARASAAALEAAFPGAPGGPLVRCLVDAQGGDPAAARAACSAAERAAPWAPEPPHILGLIAGDEGRWTEARDLLARALARDEGDRGAWAHLAMAHRKLGDGAALEALGRRFRARFGGRLEPEW